MFRTVKTSRAAVRVAEGAHKVLYAGEATERRDLLYREVGVHQQVTHALQADLADLLARRVTDK